MEYAEARTLLEAMTQWDTDPALTSGEVSLLMETARRADVDGNPIDRPWQESTYYRLDTYVIPTATGGNGHVYRTTTAGISGTIEPTWVTTSGATVSGTAGGGTALVFTEAGVSAWVPTWDLNHAAAEGWRWKAAKVATEFDFSTDGQSFKRDQQRAACLEMAESYAKKTATSVRVGPSSTYSR